MLHQSLLYSKVTQLHTYILFFFFNILFHYGLTQDIEHGSVGYLEGPCVYPSYI